MGILDNEVLMESLGGALATIGGFATIIALIQGLISWYKLRCETEKEYFMIGNSKELKKERFEVRHNTRTFDEYKNDGEFMVTISSAVEFFETWARMAKRHYLPFRVFKGAVGIGVCTFFDSVSDYIYNMRKNNPYFAENYEWLYKKIHKKYID